MDISLRSATYDDKDFYFLIRKTTIKPYTDEYSEWNDENEYENILLKINPVQDKVIMTNGIDIGLLSVSDFNDVIFIEMINIVKEYQNRGLGKWILFWIIDGAKQKGKNIQLDTYQNNTRAIAFYLKYGFSIIGYTNKKYPKVKMEFKVNKFEHESI